MKTTVLKSAGSIRKRQDGRWECRLSVNGVSKSIYGSTKKELIQKRNEYMLRIGSGLIEPKKVQFNVIAEIFLYQYKINRVKPNTFDSLENSWKCHVKESLIGDMLIGNIRTYDIQRLIDEKRTSNDKPLALSGIKRILDFLNQIFEYMIAQNMLNKSENPMTDIIVPKEEDMIVKSKELFCLTDEELQTLKAVCLQKTAKGLYKYQFGPLFMLLANTGLRIGELLALDVSDINLEKKYIKINKAWESGLINRSGEGNRRLFVMGSTKTKHANRLVPLNENAMFYIQEIIEDNKKRGFDSEILCCSRTGTRATARNMQRTLNTLTQKAEMKHVTLHIFRHTFGSTLLRNGVSIEVVSSILGHASVKITYDHYIHVIEEQQISAMELGNVI